VSQIEALLTHLLDDAKTSRRVARHEALGEVVQDLAARDAQDSSHRLAIEPLIVPGNDLVEETHRVTHAARSFSGDDGQPGFVRRNPLCAEHVPQAIGDESRRDHLEVEALDTAEDRDWNLVHLGRREDELDVRWRLLKRLQKRVPRALREHVDFVDDKDLVAISRRSIGQAVLQLSDFVDAVVACAVYFPDVDVASGRDLLTRGAFETRGRRRTWIRITLFTIGAETVECAGQETGARRLADSSNPRK
jgi:hypothetical protein